MPLKRTSEIKVGIFALVTLGAFLASVIILTSESSLFRSSITLHARFGDIAGMIDGSEVRLSGVTVGFVQNIEFSPSDNNPTVYVTFSVDDRGMDRVAKDSKVTIASLGLLGKKYLQIIPGEMSVGRVEDGDSLKGIDPSSMTEALDEAAAAVETIKRVGSHLETLIGSLAGEADFETALSRTVSSIKRIVEQVEKGPSALNNLIYDPTRVQIITDLAATVRRIREVATRITTGPGNIHEVIYGEQVKAFIEDLEKTSQVLREVIADIKEEDGVLHSLVYDPKNKEILADLHEASTSLKNIAQAIERGEGTVGGLLIDPTIYEDIKKLTGEVERNRVLKTYIRYVVQKREADKQAGEEPPANPPE